MLEFLQTNGLLVIVAIVNFLLVLSRNSLWGHGQHQGYRGASITTGNATDTPSFSVAEPSRNGQIAKTGISQTQPHQPQNHSGCC